MQSVVLPLQLARRPCPNFMETRQQDITQSMRGILVDWLVEVRTVKFFLSYFIYFNLTAFFFGQLTYALVISIVIY